MWFTIMFLNRFDIFYLLVNVCTRIKKYEWMFGPLIFRWMAGTGKRLKHAGELHVVCRVSWARFTWCFVIFRKNYDAPIALHVTILYGEVLILRSIIEWKGSIRLSNHIRYAKTTTFEMRLRGFIRYYMIFTWIMTHLLWNIWKSTRSYLLAHTWFSSGLRLASESLPVPSRSLPLPSY